MASADELAKDGRRPTAGRLAYEKPAIVWEQPLVERTGLLAACGKVGGDTECETTTPPVDAS